MADESKGGEIVGGLRVVVCGLVCVELVQDSAMESKLARRDPAPGDKAVLGECGKVDRGGLLWSLEAICSLVSRSSSAESLLRLRREGDCICSCGGTRDVGE